MIGHPWPTGSHSLDLVWTSFRPRWDLVWVQCPCRLWHHTPTVACIAFKVVTTALKKNCAVRFVIKPHFARWCVVGRQTFPPIACPQNMCCLKYGLLQALMLCMIVTHCKTGHPEIFDESRCAIRELDSLCFQWIHLLVECQLQTTYPSQIEDGRLEFISVLRRLV